MYDESRPESTNIFGGPAPRAAGDPSGLSEPDQQSPRQRATPRTPRGLRGVGLACLAAALVAFGGVVGARLGSRAPPRVPVGPPARAREPTRAARRRAVAAQPRSR